MGQIGHPLGLFGPFLPFDRVRGVVREEQGPPSVVVRELRLLADPGDVDGER